MFSSIIWSRLSIRHPQANVTIAFVKYLNRARDTEGPTVLILPRDPTWYRRSPDYSWRARASARVK